MNEQQRYEQATAVFLEAYALSESLRAAFVSRRCAGDAELLGLVERLLEASRHKSVFASLAEQLSTMHAQIRREANELSLPSEERAGDTIDRFQLVKPLGEGGFGRVWLAEQRTPVRRLVALKVIKAGMDSKQIVARFDQERQALAVMDHAHIAKVFDAGTTLTGRPYFVMEFCEGSSIVAHCDTHKLAIPERLELFMQACRAVQHAHTKGVVHRDIKPSNVLVVKHDDQPQVKIIDFGIAKALEAPLTEQTFFTEHRQLIGTPEYMSPEQADGDLDIDTRTDVYSLGVLLYELLTGTTPFSGHDLRQAAFGELQRIIREVDPPKPSTRLQRSTVTISAIAENRRTEPRKLDSTVRGELDWIAMKALEKDRTRRYESASTLAADLQRYLNGEAIHAAPPSRTYLTRKFVRRHRGAVLAVSAVVLALTAGLFAFAWQARIAISERNRALAAEHESNQRAAELQNVSDFQAQMLAQVDAPSAGQRLMNYMQTKFATALEHTGLNAEQQTNEKETFARYLTRIDATDAAVEMIDSMILAPAVNAVDRQFADQPLVDAKLRDVLSDRYRDLGRIDQSMTLAQKAQSQFRAAAGAEDPRTLQAATKIGLLLEHQGAASDSEHLLRATLETQRRVLGNLHPTTLYTLTQIGRVLVDQGRSSEAQPFFTEALEGWRLVNGDDCAEAFDAASALADIQSLLGNLNESERLYTGLIERMRRVLGNEHWATIAAIGALGRTYYRAAKYAEAEVCFREIIALRSKVQGASHQDTLTAIDSLVAVLAQTGRASEADVLRRNNLEQMRKTLGSDHPRVLEMCSNYCVQATTAGGAAEVEALARDTLKRRLLVLGANHPQTLVSYNVMGYVLRAQRKHAEAESYLREALTISRTVLGEDHPDRLLYLVNMGALSTSLGHLEEAEVCFREMLTRADQTLGPAHPTTLEAVKRLGELLIRQNRYAEVVEVLAGAEGGAREAYGETRCAELSSFLTRLARSRTRELTFEAAEVNLLEAQSLAQATGAVSPRENTDAIEGLIELYDMWHAADPDAGHAEMAERWRTALATGASGIGVGP